MHQQGHEGQGHGCEREREEEPQEPPRPPATALPAKLPAHKSKKSVRRRWLDPIYLRQKKDAPYEMPYYSTSVFCVAADLSLSLAT
jgi:hypothetical protein